MDGYWAQPVIDRHQMPMFSPTLDDLIPEDHPVRIYEEVLRRLDWGDWEMKYHGERGQPPIHPRIVAAVILYGMTLRIRSSRGLEDACRHRIDFMWLAQGRALDHSTISGFRKDFAEQLKSLFRQVGRLAVKMGFVRLVEVALDGTKVRANSSRDRTGTAQTLEKQMAELEEQLTQALAEMAETDRQDDERFGADESGQRLPAALSSQQKRKEKLEKALEVAKRIDESRRKYGGARAKKPARVPLTDPEATVLPNKEGGFAPNYTPTAAVDGHRGMIVDAEVISEGSEASVALPAMDRIQEDLGKYPHRALMDGAYGTGPNLEGLESRQIEVLTPLGKEGQTNPAQREDPTQPVPTEQWPQLPRNGQGQLDKVCFVYLESQDVYYCPTGQVLEYDTTKYVQREGGRAKCRIYRCRSCQGCPLAKQCLSPRAAARTIRRDQYEKCRERVTARMRTDEAEALYGLRMMIAETPFGHIKHVMGVRQFLLRGLENVRTEWRWTCTAFNLAKLVRYIGQLRARLTELALG